MSVLVSSKHSNQDIHSRISRWYYRAQFLDITLTQILIHPDDAAKAPALFMGLPVVPMTRLVF